MDVWKLQININKEAGESETLFEELVIKPELFNRCRDEGIKRKERGTYVDEA